MFHIIFTIYIYDLTFILGDGGELQARGLTTFSVKWSVKPLNIFVGGMLHL